ncbi:hypothetical protein V1514DRAFT_328053 [Lipomyces japonicus]|uniref:uncharacterized protein n=1 Tax=Lipomyces japonicus TaxID=56871 RepID=UPI0034CE2489
MICVQDFNSGLTNFVRQDYERRQVSSGDATFASWQMLNEHFINVSNVYVLGYMTIRNKILANKFYTASITYYTLVFIPFYTMYICEGELVRLLLHIYIYIYIYIRRKWKLPLRWTVLFSNLAEGL